MGRGKNIAHTNRKDSARPIRGSEQLYSGQRIRLPTGNDVVLGFLHAGEWECQWVKEAEHSGDVSFTDKFLRSYGRIVHGAANGAYSAGPDGRASWPVPPQGKAQGPGGGHGH